MCCRNDDRACSGNHGIRFQRTDIAGAETIPALYSNVVDTRNCTCLGASPQNIVSTIEHIMSVFYILGIDNALVKVNNPEVPILDGTAANFCVFCNRRNWLFKMPRAVF